MNPVPPESPTDIPTPILGSSERQSSGWDIRNASRNYLSLVLFQIGSAALSFGAVWLITRQRNLGPEGYGAVVAIIAASQVAQILVNWTSIAVVRFGVDEFVESAVISRTFWSRFIILFANMVLVLALSGLWFTPLADWLKLAPGAFWLVIAHFIFTALWLHVQMSLQGAKMLQTQGLLQMIERLLIFMGIVLLLASNRLEFKYVVSCYIAAPAVMIAAGIYKLRTHIFSRFSIERKFFTRILVYSLPLLPFSIVGYLSGSYIDAAFVSNFLSTRDLGIYSLATQVNGITMQIPALANSILLPLFVTLRRESKDQRKSNYFRNVVPGLTLLWGAGCAALSFIGYILVPVVFGTEFDGAVLPIWILLTASVVAFPVAVGYSALSNSASTTYVPMVATFLAAAVNIGGNFILIPKYGMAGCALATLLAFLTSAAAFAILLNRTAEMPVSWTFLAVVPSIGGALSYALYERAWLALMVCLILSFAIGIFYRHSINEMVKFILNFGRLKREPG